MATPVCGVENCAIRKIEVCPPGAPFACTDDLGVKVLMTGTGLVPAYGLTQDNPGGDLAIPAAGLDPTCQTVSARAFTAFSPNPFVSVLGAQCTDITSCPQCLFAEVGINKCTPSKPSIDPHAIEDLVTSGPSECLIAWIIHFACPFRGRICLQFCCMA